MGAIEVVALSEPRPGKSRALNRAVVAARGDALMFTDDDVRPPADWIASMTEPITSHAADGVAGGVRLAQCLRRPWIHRAQRSWLASTEDLPKDSSHPLIGANMAVSRRVFERVPRFDEEVGPGAVGHAEDTLFWLQLREAGYRLATRLDVEVEHHLSEDRLSWHAFERLANKRGEFAAYVEHHWEHYQRPRPIIGVATAAVRLWGKRLMHLPEWLRAQTMPEWELGPLDEFYTRWHLLKERRRPRKYERHGLVKLEPGRPPSDERTKTPVAAPLPLSETA